DGVAWAIEKFVLNPDHSSGHFPAR
ncbi:hypothetical protein MJK86_23755, partial [Salmonella enterica subsp. enterica serovar Kentucky]|nr:hypothetical protein [Salmonella enterica subsp. enterica serovar Kentucky]